ncbi:MAG TPA: TetR/AcrR family transcriptional regulator [Polyangiales bacterium]|nr:TetR/AcrR family transcriptional regulator [Polyangiales bacterium]
MSKGEDTRQQILDGGTQLASKLGIRGVTIGRLATHLGLSKSGLFAHFKSKDALDAALIAYAGGLFVDRVVRPALQQPRGEPRLRALFFAALAWPTQSGLPGGCPLIAAAGELDDCPGAARDALVENQRDWLDTLANIVRVAEKEGHFTGALSAEQFAWEMYGIQLVHHLATRLLNDRKADQQATIAFEALVQRAKAPHA